MNIGANYIGGNSCEFSIWAPLLQKMELKLTAPSERLIPLDRDDMGYWRANIADIVPGTRYLYRLNGDNERPDPASYYQPEGVHKPSEVIDHSDFNWKDSEWQGIPLERIIIYELHIGAFTPEGIFKAVIPRLPSLKELGINAIEIMPVAQFPGCKNWGYDGVYLYAVQNSYGGPRGLKSLVNACHCLGMAVILDVVYNHLGPEGNYLAEYAPYFSDKYRTPWSQAINFDDRYSFGVRDFIIQNALYWLEKYHLDGLRLDAIQWIFDSSAMHILEELAEEVANLSLTSGRKRILIAESDLNNTRVINSRESGGYGLDAQWSDDFHHSLHTLLTGEKSGYYADFGKLDQLVKAYNEGFVYSWEYSNYRKRLYGRSSVDVPAFRHVVCVQNHDQVGNRMLGERLSNLVSFEALKLAAGAVMVSPFIPLLFMGEEYAEDNPFLYFIDHADQKLVRAVREGRKRDFAAFHWSAEPPDPFAESTFQSSIIDWSKRYSGKHRVMLKFYRELLRLRTEHPALATLSKVKLHAWSPKGYDKLLLLTRGDIENRILCLMNFAEAPVCYKDTEPVGRWQKLLDSSDAKWSGPGSTTPEFWQAGQTICLQPKSLVLLNLGKE